MPEYFTLAELRALPQMDNQSKYTDARCEAAAAFVVAGIERVVGTSFVARTVTGEVHDGGLYEIFLDAPWAVSVTSATENSVTVTDTLRLKNQRVLRYATGAYSPRSWRPGFDNIAITYQSGYSATPPADVKEAALKWTRYHLLATDSNSSMEARQTSQTNDYGTINFSVAGADAPSGYPDVDAVIVGWRKELREVPAG